MIVVDTHVRLWWTQDASLEIPAAVLSRLHDPAAAVGISALSSLEVAMLAQRGRIVLDRPARDWMGWSIAQLGLSVLPLTPAIAARAAALPPLHRDPVDRVIIATAHELDAFLLAYSAPSRTLIPTQAER